MIVDLTLAFLAGLLSFASTCVLPLVPAYVTYMGAASAGTTMTLRQQLGVLGNAALFVAGFGSAFVALGASFGLIGADLKAYRPLLLQVAGVALVLIGIALLTVGRIPGLMGEKRFDIAHRLPRAPWASYVIGLAFAIGWTPCVGPILAAILLRAGSSGTAAQGAVLLAVYSAGLGLPFLVAAGLSGMLTQVLSRIRGAYGILNAVAAAFLIGMGLLIFSNRLTVFNDFFPVVAVTTPWDSHFQSDEGTLPATHGPVQVGQPAPSFTLTDIDGHRVSLSQLKGKPVLISFWATWCVPCRDELPLIRDEYLAHHTEGLEVVAIDWGDESADTVRRFWTGLKLQPAPYLDPDGRAATAYGVTLSSTGLPVSILVARDGTVSSYEPFPLTKEFLDPALTKILS
ncbi:MAG: redoxin domain-containing protein [Chloroflexi bacterium]|nr:MAG: redoxin domain-containing protein [Chloroflexota bacterium]TMD82630.1 MAG: redoxin domain-containing protein [Chloroflexota bacterium]